jgi:choline dehydrogenase-like flavoprotein
VANLFVADGSSLPASGGANPTRTLQAVALRSAEHIWIERATL